jgi:glucan phosphoethanolaminetransferase (alkaline phosphatase superfamily)
LGFFLAVLYDAFYLLHKKLRKRWFLVLADIVFALVFTFSFFCFLIAYNGGEFRAVFIAVCLASISLFLALFRKICRVFNKLLKRG